MGSCAQRADGISKAAMAAAAGALALAVASGCGIKASLDKAGSFASMAGGGTDAALMGTFRLVSAQSATRGETSLIALRTDFTFHAVYYADCDSGACPVDVDGDYRQFREFPDPTKAAGVALSGQFKDPKSGAQTPFYLLLRRAQVEGSPQLGLYHLAETAYDGQRPYFVLSHPYELWCADVADCERQDGQCASVFSCVDNLCKCP